MSARVFNPSVMSELARLRSSTKYASSTSANVVEINRVRRELFGPVDLEEARQFCERELSMQQNNDSDRWGYDFKHDKPQIEHHRYVWTRVKTENIPEPYLYTNRYFRPVSREAITPQKNELTDCSDDNMSTTTITDILDAGLPSTVIVPTPQTTYKQKPEARPKQALMTDFMRSRKRPMTPALGKKTSAPTYDSAPPAKIVRRMHFS